MEPDYDGYVLVEAVNLYTNIYDTSQLSVVRGSSFLVKEAVESLTKQFTVLKCISSGASSGLFRFKPNADAPDLDALSEKIQTYLDGHHLYQLATFCIVCCGNIPFTQAQTVLNAKLRRQQLCTTMVSTVAAQRAPDAQAACAYNGVLPATEQSLLPKNPEQQNTPLASASVNRRFEYGRDQRQAFYAKEFEHHNIENPAYRLKFYDNLQDIATHSNSKHRLNGKVALLYVDGNRFGKIRRKHVKTPSDLTKFDDGLKHWRAKLLAYVLGQMINNNAGFKHCVTNDKIRFETLLWGGLAHAAGLVFCRAKTPIKQMRVLAEQLAEHVKGQSGGRDADHFDYVVLESVDYSSDQSYSDYLAARYPAAYKQRTAMLSPCTDWTNTKGKLQEILPDIGKGVVYRLAFAVTSGHLAQVNALEKRLQTLKGQEPTESLLSALASLLGQATDAYMALESSNLTIAWRWIHLVELWDYLDIEGDKEDSQDA